jgi:hypothetical protein
MYHITQIVCGYVGHLTVSALTVECDKSNELPVFVYLPSQNLLHSDDSFILDKQTNYFCVNSQYHSICQVAKYTSYGNVMTVTR